MGALDLGSQEEAAENPNYLRYVSAAYVHVSAVNEDKKGILRLQALISVVNDTASLIKVVSVAQSVYAANMKVNTARSRVVMEVVGWLLGDNKELGWLLGGYKWLGKVVNKCTLPTQGMRSIVSTVSISLEGFLPSILLLVVIIVTVVIVVVMVILVVVVAIIRVVIVVTIIG
ncbi:hypothetical protein Tco_0555725, partial [Tanacetum coccineum]